MARTRNIKPGFFKSEQLADCDPLARILFAGLWTQADREGILEDRPRRIKSECLPYDECDIEELLSQLITSEFITRYEVNGCKYIYIPTFKAHQNPHRDEKSHGFPKPPNQHHASTVQTPCEHSCSTALTRSPSTLNLKPETLNASTVQASGACADENAGTKNGKRPSVFDAVTVATLKSPAKLDNWWRMAASLHRPAVSGSDQDRLRVHSAAEKVLDPKTKTNNAVNLFRWIVGGKRWTHLADGHDDKAHERIKELDREARGESVSQ